MRSWPKKAKKTLDNYQTWWSREVVLYKGDDIVDQGTIKEVAERRGVQKRTIYYYTMPAGHRRAARRKTSGLVAEVVS